MAQLEIRTNPDALLGTPLATGLRGAGELPVAFWQARLRDDDGRIWRSSGRTAAELGEVWKPAKDSTGPIAALRSLHPLEIDVRAELPDGRSATRTVKRILLAEGTRVRSWKGLTPLRATLYLPRAERASAALIIDALGAENTDALAPTAALLASRGVAVVTAEPGAKQTPPDALTDLVTLLAAVPAAQGAGTPAIRTMLPLPPGFPTTIAPDPAAWTTLLGQSAAR